MAQCFPPKVQGGGRAVVLPAGPQWDPLGSLTRLPWNLRKQRHVSYLGLQRLRQETGEQSFLRKEGDYSEGGWVGGAAPLELLTISHGPNVEPDRQSWKRTVASTEVDRSPGQVHGWRVVVENRGRDIQPREASLVKDLVGKWTQRAAGVQRKPTNSWEFECLPPEVSKTDWHSISRVLYKGTLLGQTLILGQALCIQVLSVFHLPTTTPWRDATIRISQASWWVLADSAWGPSRCVSLPEFSGSFSFLPPCPCCIHFFLGLHTEGEHPVGWVFWKTAHAPSPLQASVWPSGTCSPFLIQPNSNSPVSPPLPTLTVDDQPWMDPTITGLKISYTAYPGVPRTGPKKKAQACSGPHQISTRTIWLWLVKPYVTALSTPWLKDFF